VLDGVLFWNDVPLELAGGAIENFGPANVGVEGDNQIKVEVHGPVVLFRHEILSEKNLQADSRGPVKVVRV
jgi:hypothetical protein